MSIPGDLEQARHLALASDETAAKDLLLSLMPQIEIADRDDWMLEALAQLGELYLVRTAYDGVREGARRIRECLEVYSSILAGTARHVGGLQGGGLAEVQGGRGVDDQRVVAGDQRVEQAAQAQGAGGVLGQGAAEASRLRSPGSRSR